MKVLEFWDANLKFIDENPRGFWNVLENLQALELYELSKSWFSMSTTTPLLFGSVFTKLKNSFYESICTHNYLEVSITLQHFGFLFDWMAIRRYKFWVPNETLNSLQIELSMELTVFELFSHTLPFFWLNLLNNLQPSRHSYTLLDDDLDFSLLVDCRKNHVLRFYAPTCRSLFYGGVLS